MKNLTRLIVTVFALSLGSFAFAGDAKNHKEACKDCKDCKECCKDGPCGCKAEKEGKKDEKAPEKK